MPSENTGGKYESYRNCKEDRRPRQGRYTQGDQKNYADSRGRPVADNVDIERKVLFWYVGFS